MFIESYREQSHCYAKREIHPPALNRNVLRSSLAVYKGLTLRLHSSVTS